MYIIGDKISINTANEILGIIRFSEEYINEYSTQIINELLDGNNIIGVYFENKNKAGYMYYHSIIKDEFYNKKIKALLNMNNIQAMNVGSISKYYMTQHINISRI